MIDQWMSLGKTALDAGKYDEAFDYFSRVVNDQPNHWEAILNKGIAAGLQSTWHSSRIDEFFQGVNKSFNLLWDSTKNDDERVHLAFMKYDWVYSFFETLLSKIKYLQDKKVWISHNYSVNDFAYVNSNLIDNIKTHVNIINIYLRGVWAMEEILNKLEKGIVEGGDKITLKYKKSLAKYLCWICDFVEYPYENAKDGFAYLGLEVTDHKELRRELVSLYDKTIDEIRKIEPDFNKGIYIDRLEEPKSKIEAMKRQSVLAKLDKERQQKKYWEEHPEEYKAHLFEEEKRRKEELEKQRIEAKRREEEREKERKLRFEKQISEIGEEISQLIEKVQKNDLEVDQLTKERERLGMFAFGKKKEINNKLIWLEDNKKRAQSRIESLKKRLHELKNTRR